MRAEHHQRGGAAVGVLNKMDAWEANLVLNLRLWCVGPDGQSRVWDEYRRALPPAEARSECHKFKALIRTITARCHRPLVRHDVTCACMGADEGIFVNLVRTASDGHLNDAALIATLLTGPAQAEQIAILAAQVGECTRKIHKQPPEYSPHTAPNIVRLH